MTIISSEKLAFQGATVLTPDGWLEDGTVLVDRRHHLLRC